MVQGFSGAGDDAFALSAAIAPILDVVRPHRRALVRGTGRRVGTLAAVGSGSTADDGARTVAGCAGMVHRVDAPRDAELTAVDAIVGDHHGHRVG